MDGGTQDLMEDEAGGGGMAAVATGPETQRSPRVYLGSGADELCEDLRARFIAATLELVAEGVSHPRLAETRHSPHAL